MKKLLKIGLWLVMILIVLTCGVFAWFTNTYPKVSPAPDIKVEITPERLKRGEYMAVHVAACIDCHSTRDWTSYSGPLTSGTLGKGGDVFDEKVGMPGKIVAPNITPHNLKNWTDGEIYRAITTGVRKDGTMIFPIMPWEAYNQMDPEDIKDIIAYIRTLEPIENNPPTSQIDFPVNYLIRLEAKDPQPNQRPDSSNKIKYGKYLVNAAHCVVCHTPFVAGKGSVLDSAFGGGRSVVSPMGTITTANITPDMETGIGGWTKEMFLKRFKSYQDSAELNHKVAPGEPQTIMPWRLFAGMTDSDLGAIYDYLRTVKPIKNKVTKFIPPTKEVASR